MKKTKIVATIGPASESPEVLERLLRAGMNVARLNFSHGSHATHGVVIRRLREAAERVGCPVAILQDIAGPKIRIGEIEHGPVLLEPGDMFTLTNREVTGTRREVSVNFADLPGLMRTGDRMLLADGLIELRVEEATEEDILCRVVTGGLLNSRKGINLPTRSTGIPILTGKDKADLQFGLEQQVDFIGLSFVRDARDIEYVRSVMGPGNTTPIIAKIEKPEALQHIDDIVQVVDGLMVARGDLGVEIPFEQVPAAQKQIIAKANAAAIPVITATQMLESMIHNPRPTRAEVNDVANAILDGTDAVMLSEESAMGEYPVQAVEAMARIAVQTERTFPHQQWLGRYQPDAARRIEVAISRSACEMAHSLDVAALVATTTSGMTARQVARFRPLLPVLAPTSSEQTCRRLALTWGVTPLVIPVATHTEDVLRLAFEHLLASGLLTRGQSVVVTAGIPPNEPGRTNFVTVMAVE